MPRDTDGRGRIHVRLVPRGGRDAIEGVDAEGLLRCRVAAPAVDGAANRALLRLLAAELGVPGGAVMLEAGASARVKRIALPEACAVTLAARHPGLRVG